MISLKRLLAVLLVASLVLETVPVHAFGTRPAPAPAHTVFSEQAVNALLRHFPGRLARSESAAQFRLEKTARPARFNPLEKGRTLWEAMKNRQHPGLQDTTYPLAFDTAARASFDNLAVVRTNKHVGTWTGAATVMMSDLYPNDFYIVPLESFEAGHPFRHYTLSAEEWNAVKAYLLSRPDRDAPLLIRSLISEPMPVASPDSWSTYYATMEQRDPDHVRYRQWIQPYLADQVAAAVAERAKRGRKRIRIFEDGASDGRFLRYLQEKLQTQFPDLQLEFYGNDLNAAVLGGTSDEPHFKVYAGRSEEGPLPASLNGKIDIILEKGLVTQRVVDRRQASEIVNVWDRYLKPGGTILSAPYSRSWLNSIQLPDSWTAQSRSILERFLDGETHSEFFVIHKSRNAKYAGSWVDNPFYTRWIALWLDVLPLFAYSFLLRQGDRSLWLDIFATLTSFWLPHFMGMRMFSQPSEFQKEGPGLGRRITHYFYRDFFWVFNIRDGLRKAFSWEVLLLTGVAWGSLEIILNTNALGPFVTYALLVAGRALHGLLDWRSAHEDDLARASGRRTIEQPGPKESRPAAFSEVEPDYVRLPWVLRAGGTIEMAGSEGRRPQGAVKTLIEKHIVRLGEVRSAFDSSLDSSNLAPEHWRILAAKIIQMMNEKQLPGGIIVTIGTDTVDQAALAVALLLNGHLTVPVIFTAAAKPPDEIGSDAPVNFDMALQLAEGRLPNALPPAVYFVYGGKIFLGSQIHKNIAGSPTRLQAVDKHKSFDDFVAYGREVGRWVDGRPAIDNWIYDWSNHRKLSKHPIDADFGYVELLAVDLNTPVDVLRDAATRLRNIQRTGKPVGIVLQGKLSSVRAGRQNPDMSEYRRLIKSMADTGIAVETGSRDTVEALREGIENNSGILFITDKGLNYNRARTKLAWLLGVKTPVQDLEKRLNEDIAGEAPHAADFPPEHKYQNLPSNNFRVGQEVILAFPGIDVRVFEDAARRLRASDASKKSLIIFGFGDGNLPTGDEPVDSRVSRYLRRIHSKLAKLFQLHINPGARGAPVLRSLASVMDALKQLPPKEFLRLASRYQPASARVIAQHLLVDALVVDNSGTPDKRRPDFVEMWRRLQESSNVLRHATVSVRSGMTIFEFRDQLGHVIQELSPDDWAALLWDKPQFLAARLVKEALADSHPILKTLASLTEEGVRVEIRTHASQSRSNSLPYDLGNHLMAIGVDSEITPGWKAFLLPRRLITQREAATTLRVFSRRILQSA